MINEKLARVLALARELTGKGLVAYMWYSGNIDGIDVRVEQPTKERHCCKCDGPKLRLIDENIYLDRVGADEKLGNLIDRMEKLIAGVWVDDLADMCVGGQWQ